VDARHNPAAPDIILKNIPPGRYQVHYRNRDGSVVNLRRVEIR
jgi:hypothetical protein